jgi:hypothetical protein
MVLCKGSSPVLSWCSYCRFVRSCNSRMRIIRHSVARRTRQPYERNVGGEERKGRSPGCESVGRRALLFCAMASALCQIRPEPYMFFSQYIALKDDQIANIGHGKVVAQVLPTSAPSEIVAFGAIYIKASPEDYLRLAQNLNNFRGLPNYLGIRQCSAPPKLSDFGGFVLEDDDINELKSCRPGKCQLQLPTESMEEFQKLVDWSAPDVVAQVNKLAQKMALGELSQYQKDGDSALGTYSDKKYPLRLADQFASC